MHSLLLGIFIILGGFIGTIFFDAFWGLVVFTLFVHITPQQLSQLYIVPLRIPFFLSIMVLVTYVLSSKYSRKFTEWPLEFWLMLTMVIGMMLGLFNAYDPGAAWESTIAFAKFTFFFLLMVNIIDSPFKLECFYNGIMLIAAWMVYRVYDLRWTTGDRFENEGGGVVNDANQFAAALILMLPLVLNRVLDREKHWIIRVGAILGVFGMMVAIFLTGSRAGFLSLCVMILMFVIQQKRFRLKALIVLFFVLMVAGNYAPDYYWDRVSAIFVAEDIATDESAQGRLDAWKLAMELWEKHALVGIGMNNFDYYMGYQKEGLGWGERGHVTHSLWFEALAGGGIVVFVPLVLMLLLFYFRSIRIQVKYPGLSSSGIYSYISALQIGMVGFLTAATFVNRLFYEPIYWWCGIMIIYERLLLKENEKTPFPEGNGMENG